MTALDIGLDALIAHSLRETANRLDPQTQPGAFEQMLADGVIMRDELAAQRDQACIERDNALQSAAVFKADLERVESALVQVTAERDDIGVQLGFERTNSQELRDALRAMTAERDALVTRYAAVIDEQGASAAREPVVLARVLDELDLPNEATS